MSYPLLYLNNVPCHNHDMYGHRKSSSSSSSANRLLRANTGASAAVVVDGPFSDLQAYMTLPVSEYSLLDSSIIRRVSETSFRFQVRSRERGEIPIRDKICHTPWTDFLPPMFAIGVGIRRLAAML